MHRLHPNRQHRQLAHNGHQRQSRRQRGEHERRQLGWKQWHGHRLFCQRWHCGQRLFRQQLGKLEQRQLDHRGRPLCSTAADCAGLGTLACIDGGCAAPSPLPDLACTGIGNPCGATSPPCCQGNCGAAGFCTAWPACAPIGGTCQHDGDCCTRERCRAGTCASSCGTFSQACAADSDCCTETGLRCLPPTLPTGTPLVCRAASLNGGSGCTPTVTPGSSAPQCDLGVACTLGPGGSDPCAPAGLVCDAFVQICRQPLIYEACVPGGPPCQAILDSTEADLRCVNENAGGPAAYRCLEPCAETSDCIRKSTRCVPLFTGASQRACFGNYDCTNYFGPCDAEASADGTCVPVIDSAGAVAGECWQAADAGPTCSSAANRQIGGLCPVGDVCVVGLCQQGCNAGTEGSPSCSAAGTVCQALSRVSDPVDEGACALSCDYTSDAGGGCPASGVAEKCQAAWIATGIDSAGGICTAAVNSPVPVGQPCVEGPLDPCVAGAACAVVQGGSEVLCRQLCFLDNPVCPPGRSCQTWHVNGVASQFVGKCQ